MAEVLTKEGPAGVPTYQCPYCSRLYLQQVVNETGEVTDQKADPPRACRRCGSPMDVAVKDGLSLAQKFQDEMAEKAAQSAVRPGRQTVKI